MVEWQNIDVPLSVGVNTRDDAKLLPPMKLIDLQNATFSKGGALKKRSGYTYLNKTTLAVGPATISAAKRLATRGNDLVLLDGSDLYSYVESADRWVNRGDLPGVGLTVTSLANSSEAQYSTNCATANGYTVYTWESFASAAYSTYFAVYDSQNVAVQAATTFGTNMRHARVLAVGSIILIVYHDLTANDLKVKRIDTSSTANLITSLASSVIALGYSDISDNNVFDACSTGTYVAFCVGTTASTIRVGTITSAGALGVNGTGFGSVATGKVAATAGGAVMTLDINVSTNTGLLFWEDGAGLLAACSLTNVVAGSGSITFGATRTVDATAASAERLTCLATSTTDTGHLWWYNDTDAKSFYKTYTAGVLSNDAERAYPSFIASKAFWFGTTPLVHVHFDSTTQPTLFLVDTAFMPYARVNAGTSHGGGVLPTVSGSYEFGALVKRRLGSDAYAEPSVVRVQYDFSSPPLPCVQYRDSLLIGSGFLWQYDGAAPVEAGFLLYPEIYENTPPVASNGSGSLTSNTSVAYAAYWEWWDEQDNRHMSAASATITVALGATDDTVVLTFKPLPYTWKQGTRAAPNLALYRTAGDGTVRYRVSSFNPSSTSVSSSGYYLANDPDALTLTYEDRLSDALLIDNELDPYNPNDAGLQQVDSIPPPAPSALHSAQDRVWAVAAESPRRVYYSKLPQAETAVEFNDGLYLELPEDIQGIGDVLGRPVFFAADRIYTLDGEGPDNNGVGVYSRVEQLPCDVGLYVPDTLVETPLGWMFQSRKGFRLLSHSLQVDPNFGNEPDTYRSQTFTGAVLLPDANAVRFLTSSGRTLHFDYERGQWSTFTGITGVSSAAWDGVYCYVTSAGQVCKETAGTYTDNGTNIAQLVETSWIRPGGVQGFARLQRVLMLANWKSTHTLTIEVAYDFEDAYTESITVTPTAAVIAGTAAYQIRHRLTRQKCNAIKFRITEVPGTGAGLELNALGLRIGIKGGQNRLGDRTI